MKKFSSTLKSCPLFLGLDENDISKALECICMYKKEYKKNEYVFRLGDKMKYLGVLAKGSIFLEKEDFLGNKTIISPIFENDVFGASFYNERNSLPFNILCSEKSTILFLDIDKAFNTSKSCCCLVYKIYKNFVDLILIKNINMNKKLIHISERTIRNKIISYLTEESIRSKSNEFYIPFNRQQLADYLCVDRSALSSELSKMQKENIINYNKNYFKIIKNLDFI